MKYGKTDGILPLEVIVCVYEKGGSMQQKRVYFAGAITGGNNSVIIMMRRMVSFMREHGIPVLTDHVVADNPREAIAQKIGKTLNELRPEDIERKDAEWLDVATHVVAEVTCPSTGVGREVEYARTKGSLGNIPAEILCLYLKGMEKSVTPMIRGMERDRYLNVSVRPYLDTREAETEIAKFLGIM